jgi:hypothetical protein
MFFLHRFIHRNAPFRYGLRISRQYYLLRDFFCVATVPFAISDTGIISYLLTQINSKVALQGRGATTHFFGDNEFKKFYEDVREVCFATAWKKRVSSISVERI